MGLWSFGVPPTGVTIYVATRRLFNTDSTEFSESPSGTFGWVRIIALRWSDATEPSARFSVSPLPNPSISPQAVGSLLILTLPSASKMPNSQLSAALRAKSPTCSTIYVATRRFFNTDGTDFSESPSGTFGWVRIIALRWTDATEPAARFSIPPLLHPSDSPFLRFSVPLLLHPSISPHAVGLLRVRIPLSPCHTSQWNMP